MASRRSKSSTFPNLLHLQFPSSDDESPIFPNNKRKINRRQFKDSSDESSENGHVHEQGLSSPVGPISTFKSRSKRNQQLTHDSESDAEQHFVQCNQSNPNNHHNHNHNHNHNHHHNDSKHADKPIDFIHQFSSRHDSTTEDEEEVKSTSTYNRSISSNSNTINSNNISNNIYRYVINNDSSSMLFYA